jgi:hypothetical protein
VGLHCSRVPLEEEFKTDTKEYVPIEAIFRSIQSQNVELAHALRYDPEKDGRDASHYIDQVPEREMVKLLHQIASLKILHNAVLAGGNPIKQKQRYQHWVNRVIIGKLKERIPFSDPRWKYICFNQHIKLLGVPDMPPTMRSLFETKVPLTERNAVRQIRFTMQQLSLITSSMTQRIKIIQNSLSAQEQKQYKAKLISDINAAVKTSQALNQLIEEYRLHEEVSYSVSGFNESIQRRAEELYAYIYDLPTMHPHKGGRASAAMVRVRNSVNAFSNTIKTYSSRMDELIRHIERTLQPFSLN